METQPRVRPGTPAGGQFAANARPDAGTELLSDAAPKLPPWGQELDDRINHGIKEHLSDEWERDGSSVDVATILGTYEDELTEAYGSQRARWLIGLEVWIKSDTSLSYGASDDGPAEYQTIGKVTITEPGGRLVTSASFTDEDGPELGPVSAWAAQYPPVSKEAA
jgi:hypothetical protein